MPLEKQIQRCLQAWAWLGWLAQQMREHNQTVFYAEHLRPDWLDERQQRWYVWLAIRVPTIIVGILVGAFIAAILANDGWVLIQYGLIGGFLGGWISQQEHTHIVPAGEIIPAKRKLLWRRGSHIFSSILLGLSLGISVNLPWVSYNLGTWLRNMAIFGPIIGLSGWTLQALLPRATRSPAASPVKLTSYRTRLPTWSKTIHSRRILLSAILLGMPIGLGYGLTFYTGLLNQGWSYALTNGLANTLGYGLTWGVSISFTALFISTIFEINKGGLRLAERLHWNGLYLISLKHLQISMLVACLPLFLALMFGLSYGIGVVLNWNSSIGLVYGLSYGLGYGPIWGLGIGLGYWFLFGLYRGIFPEH